MAYPSTLQLEEGIIYMNEVGKMFPMGQKGETPDGRIFRHTLTGAAINASALCQSRGTVTTSDNMVIPAGSNVVATDNKIKITNESVTWTKDELENGFIVSETNTSSTGPNCWRIGGNEYSTSTNPLVIELAEGLTFGRTLAAGTDKMLIMPSPWSKTIIHPGSVSGFAVGVSMRKLLSGYYGWLQTRGVAGVMMDDGDTKKTVGESLVADQTTAGNVENIESGTYRFVVGNTITVQGQSDGKVILVWLTIE